MMKRRMPVLFIFVAGLLKEQCFQIIHNQDLMSAKEKTQYSNIISADHTLKNDKSHKHLFH